MPKLRTIALIVLILPLTACVYRMDIVQGNQIEEEDIEQLEEGMTRDQVQFLLGTPMLKDPFHSDRAHFHYYLDTQRGFRSMERRLTVYFDENDRVTEIKREG